MQSLRNDVGKLDYMAEYLSLSLEEVQEFYNKTLNQKKSLEDKATAGIIGVTIAVSLVTGLASLPFSMGEAQLDSTILRVLILVFGLISLVYMSMSAWLSLVVLGEKNIVYQLSPKNMRLPENEKLRQIALNTEQNVNLNIVRNNYIYATYRSIFYAIISLGMMFVLIAVGAFFCL